MTINPPLFTVVDKFGKQHRVVLFDNTFKGRLLFFYGQFEPKGAFLGLPPVHKADLTAWLERILDEWRNFLILCEDKISGHVALDCFHNPRSFELMIFIHQDHRFRGVGTGVLAGLKDLLSNQESREIWLVVQNSNIPAVKCFQKVGFAFMGPIAAEREMVCHLQKVGLQ